MLVKVLADIKKKEDTAGKFGHLQRNTRMKAVQYKIVVEERRREDLITE